MCRARTPTLPSTDDDCVTEYHQFEAPADGQSIGLKKGQAPICILLAVILGIGAHAAEESLAPAEPALEALGLNPVAYSLLAVAPMIVGFASPMLWGYIWDRYSLRWVVLGAPAGLLLGGLLAAIGLIFVQAEAASAGAALGGSLLCISASRAGVNIAQFSIVGAVSGDHGPLGFACLVVAKHAMSCVMASVVPRVLARYPSDELAGLLHVQLVVLVPHLISILAGAALAAFVLPDALQPRQHLPAAAAHVAPHKWQHAGPVKVESPNRQIDLGVPLLGGAMPDADAATTRGHHAVPRADAHDGGKGSPLARSLAGLVALARGGTRDDTVVVIALIGLWRAVQVGTLHAYHTVRIEMLASVHSVRITEAGSLIATNDALAMLLLPLLAVLTIRITRLRPWLAAAPLLSLAACAHFALGAMSMHQPPSGIDSGADGSSASLGLASVGLAPRAELFILSVMEVSAPVVPLALLPLNVGSNLGLAYGTLDTIFHCTQIALTVLLGGVRMSAGFGGALVLLCVGFATAALTALPLIGRARDLKRSAAPSSRAMIAPTRLADALAWSSSETSSENGRQQASSV